jgi:ubiquinone/menaquinone biosynthesis C-methylase UbiE
MPNLRVAHAYDRNRYHPPEVSGRIATAISDPVERAFRDAHILEVGVGTGRIGMPVVARGFRFTGIDTNPDMMELFRAKFSGVSRKVSIFRASAEELPFPDQTFQAVISVHVWHLIADLQAAVSEAVRVLKPGGFLFEGWDAPAPGGAEREIQDRWCEAVSVYGYDIQRGSHKAALETSQGYLTEMGLESREAVIARWEVTHTPNEVLEALAEGLFSFTRNVPAEVRFKAARDIRDWVEQRYPDTEAAIKTAWSFHMRTTRVPAARS